MVYTHHPPPGNKHGTTTQAAQDAQCAAQLLDHHTETYGGPGPQTSARHNTRVLYCRNLQLATCAHAMKHLRDLRSMYDGAIRAKRDYQQVVDARLRVVINVTCTDQRL